jgi:hypothetical protein
MPVDRAQLAKILSLLGSAHDGEALAAARRAHSLVKAGGDTWEKLLAEEPAPARANIHGAPPPAAAKRARLLTTYDMYQSLQASSRVPQEVKKRLRGLEKALIDGELTVADIAEIKHLFEQLLGSRSART